MYKKKKRAITLIEMMIVMFLIAMIIGVIGYNYQGSLEEGKVFKTRAGIEKIKTILSLRLAEDPNTFNDISRWKDIVKSSPLAQNGNSLVKDGWGVDYEVTVGNRDDGEAEFIVTSRRLEEYKIRHPEKFAN